MALRLKQQIKITESFIKKAIKDYFDKMGWFHFPLLQGLGSYKGLPDIIACKDGKTLFIEVKTETGEQTIPQQRFQRNIQRVGCHYIVARSVCDIIDFLEALDTSKA